MNNGSNITDEVKEGIHSPSCVNKGDNTSKNKTRSMIRFLYRKSLIFVDLWSNSADLEATLMVTL